MPRSASTTAYPISRAYLRSEGIETFLLNINADLGYPLDLDRIKRDVMRIAPDVIGFSVLTNQYKYALEIAAHLRTYYDRPIVFGGIHPTMDPHGTLKEPVLDSICVGEGEEAFLESIRAGGPRGCGTWATGTAAGRSWSL